MTAREPLDLDAVESTWLSECGPCDYGLPMSCACPPTDGDPRPTMSKLVAEVRTLRVEVAEVEADRDLLATTLAATQAELDAAVMEIERLRAQLGEATVKAAVTGGPVVRVDDGDPGKCATCGDPLAWTGAPGSQRIHAWSGRLGLPERPYDHAAQPEQTAVPGEPLPPLPEAAYPANATPLDEPTPCHYWRLLADWARLQIGADSAQTSTCDADATWYVELDGDKAGTLLARVCTEHRDAIRIHAGYQFAEPLRPQSSRIDDPDSPEAVDRELLRLAAETGESIDTVRAAYRVCGGGPTDNTTEGDAAR